MSYDLCFWHADQPMTSEQAVQVYWQLCDSNDTVVRPHPNIAVFVQEVAQHYPQIDAYPEEKWEECPWSNQWDVTPSSVIFCMTYPAGRALVSLLIQMANKYDLVGYNPQQEQVYLPSSLLTQGRDQQESHSSDHETAPKRPTEVWPSWEAILAAREREGSVSPEGIGD